MKASNYYYVHLTYELPTRSTYAAPLHTAVREVASCHGYYAYIPVPSGQFPVVITYIDKRTIQIG
jgi:hypothetical protein